MAKNKNGNVNGAKMVRFIETCDEHPQKFNIGHFLNSLRVFSRFPLSSERKLDFQKTLPSGYE